MGAHKTKTIGKLVRKNLILDNEAVRLLAKKRGTSESEAVRQVISEALGFEQMADEVMDAIVELRKRGTLLKNLERMFPHLRESAEETADAAP